MGQLCLVYSSFNEDWRTERRALRIGPTDRVLCITGAGDRPVHLLLDDPAEVVAVDNNPFQNHLLDLKRVAMITFDYETYAGFLGLTPCAGRGRLFEQLEPALSEEARAWWRRRRASIDAGVLYQGSWERHYCGTLAPLAGLLRGRAIRRLFDFEDLQAQQRFVREEWDRPWWRWTLRVLCSRMLLRLSLTPSCAATLDPRLNVGRYVHESMLNTLTNTLARENFMLSMTFRGRLSEHDLPPSLSPDAFEHLKSRLSLIQVHTGDVIDLLERVPAGRFTRFSLSDLPSYLDRSRLDQLLEAMVQAAAPGARFCIRQSLTGYDLPGRFAGVLVREPEVEEQLRLEDRCFVYRFWVGTVREQP